MGNRLAVIEPAHTINSYEETIVAVGNFVEYLHRLWRMHPSETIPAADLRKIGCKITRACKRFRVDIPEAMREYDTAD